MSLTCLVVVGMGLCVRASPRYDTGVGTDAAAAAIVALHVPLVPTAVSAQTAQQ